MMTSPSIECTTTECLVIVTTSVWFDLDTKYDKIVSAFVLRDPW